MYFNLGGLTPDEMKMFESFKPKPLLEIEEYVIEDNPYQGQSGLK
jgi:hypothetical protein